MKTKNTGLTMYLSYKWPSILPLIQAFRKHLEILFGEKTLFPIDLLLFREFSIKPQAYMLDIKMKQLVDKVKSAILDA